MPNQVKDLHKVDETSFPYIFEQNATVTLKAGDGLVRCNVYRPKSSGPVPVLVTYGPYGKDIPYKDFHPKSFSEVNEEQKSEHSAWETPDPGYWTRNGYAVVRADERGLGQSTGLLDTMSRGMSEAFFDVVERNQTTDNRDNKFRDDPYYASKEYDMGDIEVPLLSVGNWGGILLHLRGNIEGYLHAGSKLKYLRMITGRHDLPFYYKEEIEVQRSFLDAFLKGEDRVGWSEPGKVSPCKELGPRLVLHPD
ncbi:hypothetical protein BN1723_006868, partial [Verticillium longisporum]